MMFRKCNNSRYIYGNRGFPSIKLRLALAVISENVNKTNWSLSLGQSYCIATTPLQNVLCPHFTKKNVS